MGETARDHCEFWRVGGRCHIRPDGDERCKYWRDPPCMCRYLELFILRGRGQNRKKRRRNEFGETF